MLADEIESPRELSPRELLRRYEDRLAAVVGSTGTDRVRGETGLAEETIDGIAAGEAADVELEDVAAVLAVDGDADPETLLAAVRDRLMLEMSSAAINIDVVAVDLDLDLDAKEIQAMMEGRQPMTLEEYAVIRQYVAAKADW